MRHSAGEPLAHLRHPLDQVIQPAAQWLQTQKAQLLPGRRHCVQHEAVEHVVQVVRHQADTADCIRELQQHFLHFHQQFAEFFDFMIQLDGEYINGTVISALEHCLTRLGPFEWLG